MQDLFRFYLKILFTPCPPPPLLLAQCEEFEFICVRIHIDSELMGYKIVLSFGWSALCLKKWDTSGRLGGSVG